MAVIPAVWRKPVGVITGMSEQHRRDGSGPRGVESGPPVVPGVQLYSFPWPCLLCVSKESLFYF